MNRIKYFCRGNDTYWVLSVLISTVPVFPGEKSFNRVSCCCRCKAPRFGLVRLEGVEETSPDWAVRVVLNEVGSEATVTAYQKRLVSHGQVEGSGANATRRAGIHGTRG